MAANNNIHKLDEKYNGFHITDEKEYKRDLELLQMLRDIDTLPGVSVEGFRLTTSGAIQGFSLSEQISKLKLQWADYQEAVSRQKELEEKQEKLNKKMSKEEKRQENYGS